MNIEQNIYVYPTAQRRPSAVGNVLVMLIGLSALVTAGWLVFIVGTGLLHVLGYALGGLAGATMSVAGWVQRTLPDALRVAAADAPIVFLIIGRLVAFVAFVACCVGGIYLVLHGVEYAMKEQKHRHALQARRPVTLVEYANRLASPARTVHMLPVQQDSEVIEIPVKAKQLTR